MANPLIDAAVRYIKEHAIEHNLTEERFWKIGGVCHTCHTNIVLVVPESQQSFNSVDEDFDCPWCSSNTLKLKILSKG